MPKGHVELYCNIKIIFGVQAEARRHKHQHFKTSPALSLWRFDIFHPAFCYVGMTWRSILASSYTLGNGDRMTLAIWLSLAR